MKPSELRELLASRLAPLGLSVEMVTVSPHMPTTGVIMTPRGVRRGDIKDKPFKKTTRQKEVN
jgi:hypothetical protein